MKYYFPIVTGCTWDKLSNQAFLPWSSSMKSIGITETNRLASKKLCSCSMISVRWLIRCHKDCLDPFFGRTKIVSSRLQQNHAAAVADSRTIHHHSIFVLKLPGENRKNFTSIRLRINMNKFFRVLAIQALNKE